MNSSTAVEGFRCRPSNVPSLHRLSSFVYPNTLAALDPQISSINNQEKVVWDSSQNFYNVFLTTYTYYLKWQRLLLRGLLWIFIFVYEKSICSVYGRHIFLYNPLLWKFSVFISNI
ncbi:hypothetical protein ACSBR2_033541 [Camellia fascicularis]